jgi:restriction system protein
VMLPLLSLLAKESPLKLGDAIGRLEDYFALSSDEREQVLPSGVARTFASRVGWAKTYLKQAGLIEQPKRGELQLTKLGQALLEEGHAKISTKDLHRYPAFQAFQARSRPKATRSGGDDEIEFAGDSSDAVRDGSSSPQEVMESAAQQIDSALKAELREYVAKASPAFFENLVVRLLVRMGYGGSSEEAGQAVGRSGDGGIDGVINEDRLGLDAIYIQAKRWEQNVGEPQVRDFKGALDARGASKGVLITTSGFTAAAIEAAKNSRSYKIVLVDGDRLAELMIEHGIGVSSVATFEVRRIDSDFFEPT